MGPDTRARGAIRTPDQRVRVFVSSTLAELAPERAAVARAIRSLRLAPVMFELGARPHPPQDLYRAYLEQSDVFVGIYWQSYGWVGPGMDISGLEDELRLSAGRPRLLYLKVPAPERQPRLAEMIAAIEADGSDAYRRFTTPRELGRLVRDDLALLLSERFGSPTAAPAVSSPPGTITVGRASTVTAGSSEESSPTATQPPVRAARRGARRAIPVAATSLVGRGDDVVAVTRLLDDGARLVSLTGAGGVGKTRLAMAVADGVEGRGSVRVVFVPLATVGSPDEVLSRVASAAGVIVEGTRRPLDALEDALADEPVLIVLDNFEHLIAAAPALDELLSACPGVRMLVTSRAALRLRAEHEYRVEPLPTASEAAEPSLDEVAALPAVRLFVDRAQAVRRGFAMTAANAADVLAICRRLDGLPLAIELAAARTRLLEPRALLERLGSVLDSLGAGPVDLPERQRTLRATVDWSVGLLDERERRLLETLSVFADGWTLDAAGAVAAHEQDEVLDLLDSLAGHSLVSIDTAADEPRFRMLVTVRELAAEGLAARADAQEVAQRHARHFAALVDARGIPSDRRIRWAERLRTDDENVRIAVRWFFDHEVSALPHLLRMLWLYWQLCDRMKEGRAAIVELERRLEATPVDEHARGEVLFTAAVTAVEVGDDAAALLALAGIRELRGSVDDEDLRNHLGLAGSWAMPITGDFDGALAEAGAAYDWLRDRDDPFVAFAALTVGLLQHALGRFDEAERHLMDLEQIGVRFGNEWLTTCARTQLASVAVRVGRLGEARGLLRRAIESVDDSRASTVTASFTLTAFAELALAEGRPARAATAQGAADGLHSRAGLLTWPLMRRSEADLRTRLEVALAPGALRAAHATGFDMHSREAFALVRNGLGGDDE